MRLIRDTIVAIGDSFTDYKLSWADYLSNLLGKSLVKFTVPGASNKTILNNFYAIWAYEKITFENCLIIFQSTHIRREDLDITPGTHGYDFFKAYDLFKYLESTEDMPLKTHEIYGRKYVLSGFKTHHRWLADIWPHEVNTSWQDNVRFLSFQTNLLSEAFKTGNNKFLFLLGLHNNATADDIDFSEFPINCEIVAYKRNGKAYGIDQYVLDINQYDQTTHPTIEGHQSIVNHLVLPKLRELQWTTK